MLNAYFSIIVVCLNPGDKLKKTLESIEGQTFRNYEVIVKDGMSKDDALEYAYALSKAWEGDKNRELTVYRSKDRGIYEAMNWAAFQAMGRYLYFLNCGDVFYSPNVLQEMYDYIMERGQQNGIFYGNIYERQTGQKVVSNPKMDAFGCYRNVPCHQACFYSRETFLKHCFDVRYKVRADYEQFLWCFLKYENRHLLAFAYKDMIVVDYEGGGFSESKENQQLSAKEHKEITGKYMSRGQILWFKIILLFTMAPLRTKIAKNKKLAGAYNRVKELIYGRIGRKDE